MVITIHLRINLDRLVPFFMRVESGSRCWCSPGLQMFATPLPPIRNGFSVIFPYYRGADGLSTDISTRRLQISHTVRFGTEASLSWVFSTLGGISTAYFPRRDILSWENKLVKDHIYLTQGSCGRVEIVYSLGCSEAMLPGFVFI